MEIAAIFFLLVMLVVAYIAFRVLKKTMKMAFRAIIVLVILAIAIAGGLALWSMSGQSTNKPSTSKKNKIIPSLKSKCFNCLAY